MPDWNAIVRERLELGGIKPDLEQDVIDDLAIQLDDAYRENLARGLSEEDAEAAALAHVADWQELAQQIAASGRLAVPTPDRVEARAADAAIGGNALAGFLTGLFRDLRSTLRLRGRRSYVAFAAATLAVAVGANLVVFTIVNALWLRPLPFPDADRLVAVTGLSFLRLEAPALRPFEAVAAQVVTSDRTEGLRPQLAFDGVGRITETVGVTPGYFQLLGLTIRGRDFTPDDDRPGAEPVAIISDRLWARDFGRRADAIGAVTAATPLPVRIIGIAPPDFEGAQRGNRTDIWVPSRLVPRLVTHPVPMTLSVEGNTFSYGSEVVLPLQVFARLRPGDTAASIASRLVEEGVDSRILENIAIVPLKDVFGTPESRTIVVREGNMFGVVAGLAMLVLLGGCATLMALVLVHYERRRRDQAVKIAIGASRARLTRELLLELGLLAVLGMAGAVLVAVWVLGTMPSLSLPGGVNLGRLDLSIDWRVLAVAAGTTVLTLAAAAWMPIGRFTRARLAGELVAGPATTASVSSQRIRQTLLALHVSATVVVLVAAGLFVRAVVYGFGSAPGFDVDRTAFVTFMASTAPRDGESMDAWRTATTERTSRVKAALRALPGVDDVATGRPPLALEPATAVLAPRTVETRGERHELVVGDVYGTPELLRTLGISILAGRALTESDVTMRTSNPGPTPAVVTASLAQRLWPGESPLGQDLSVVSDGRGGARYQVVGVARDFIYGSMTRPVADVIVTARSESGGNEIFLSVRGASIGTLVEPIRQAVRTVVPEATLIRVETGHDIVTRDLGRQRLGAWFFSGFGLVALILGVGGVFGLVAYMAESRQREFGVRLALGATPAHLVRHGMLAAIVPVVVGLAVGLFAAALLARLFTSLLVGLSPLDPLTYAAITTTMLGAAALAALSAAWRLRRLAPSDALRTP